MANLDDRSKNDPFSTFAALWVQNDEDSWRTVTSRIGWGLCSRTIMFVQNGIQMLLMLGILLSNVLKNVANIRKKKYSCGRPPLKLGESQMFTSSASAPLTTFSFTLPHRAGKS